MQEASLDIWSSKYQLKTKTGEAVDKDIDATYERVARALAEVENKSVRTRHMKDFIWALQNGAIPAGRITSNAGAEAHKPATSTINCTVSGTVQDSMNDILEKNHEAGLTLKAGCGIGYEFSTLRPRGAYVAGAGATTSGPLSFMDIFDRMCFTVSSAGGRRGAQMATFDVHHPDVLEFIQAKREDGRLRQFNLSLLITEDFIEAVRNDGDWHLSFPVTRKEAEDEGLDLEDASQFVYRDFPVLDGYVVNDEGKVACRIYQTVKAQFIWDSIMTSTYDYAEPGFILIDKVNQMNNNWFCEDIRATNPCVTADTWVQTSEGPRQVEDLIGKPFTAMVDGQPHATGVEGFFKTADKQTVVLKTAEGYELTLTSDHRVRRVSAYTRYRTETEWCAAGDLRRGDQVLLQDQRAFAHWDGTLNEDQGYLLGLLVGDGTLKQDKAVLSVWQPAMAVNGGPVAAGPGAIMEAAEAAARSLPHRSDFNGWQKVSGRNEYRLSTAALKQLAEDMGMSPGNKGITARLEKSSSAAYRGFLRGLFDADGSVQGNQQKGVSIRLAQSDLPRLKATQRMLLRLGIASAIYTDRRAADSAVLPDGKGGSQAYAIEPQHELVIAGENLRRFAQEIGFADTDKQSKLETLLAGYKRQLNRERFVARVTAIETASVEAVYDVQVPGINTFDANGFHAHNCGEQPLPPYGSCLLGSVNLTKFVDYPFTDKASFNYEKYRKVVGIFTRMLDNVVEINGLPLEQQRHEITYKRRHGMGILGLGSTLTMLRMAYGSEESVRFTEEVVREMAVEGWRQSLTLAEEKGPAPIMEDNFEITPKMLSKCPRLAEEGYKVGDKLKGKVLHARYSEYMRQIAGIEPGLVEQLAEKGGRFTHHTSIAPTGTISLSLANNASNGIEPSFSHHYARNIIREGRKTKEKVDVFSFELLAYRHLVNQGAMPFSEDADKKLPDYFTTTDDVSPAQHVDIQAAAQKWVDSSISKTANVPTDFAYPDFKNIYMYAYEKGLKGCTTFRFNPEAFQGVLVKEKDLENTLYEFTLDDGSKITLRGNEQVEYDGEIHNAANLFDALKEGTYGKY
jgi:ribonucleoside-diphosphate reductase alpha chain